MKKSRFTEDQIIGVQREHQAGIPTAELELALERRRFGYRRLHILLRREGIELNHKKLFRLCREARLTAKKRGGRRRMVASS